MDSTIIFCPNIIKHYRGNKNNTLKNLFPKNNSQNNSQYSYLSFNIIIYIYI